jgi:hypothetical protein
MWAIIAIPVCIFLKELYELERVQNECMEIQRDINRRWDIINKHTSNLSDEISRIHKEHNDKRERVYIDGKWEDW